jgi:hypothetical protein
MTAIVEMATAKEVRFHLKAAETISLNVTSDLAQTAILSKTGGFLGKIGGLFEAAWDAGELPVEEGAHENVEIVKNPVKIWYAGKLIDCDLFAHMTVGRERYVGEVVDGHDPEEMPEFDESWRKLADGETVEAELTYFGVKSYSD